MPAATVRSRLRRTLARLRRTLDARFEGEQVVWTAAVVSPGTMLGETTLGAGTMFAWLGAAKVAIAIVTAAVLGAAAWFGTRPPPTPVRADQPVPIGESAERSPTEAAATDASGSRVQRLWAARRNRIVAGELAAAEGRKSTEAPEPSTDSDSAIDDAIYAQSQAFQACTDDLGIPLVGATVLRSRIHGAPDVGTIYEGLEIVGDSDARPELVECVEEHLYGYVGDPPDQPFVAVRTLTTLGASPEDLDDEGWGQRMFDTIVTAHLDEVSACAEGLPAPVSATLTLTFEDGRAAVEAELNAEGLRESVASCITDEARAWPFPPHRALANRTFDRQLMLGALGTTE